MPSVEHTLRILMLEDVPADAELVQRELARAGLLFTAKRVDSKAAFAGELTSFKPDLILSDYSLPSFDGLSALALARERCPAVPFIFVSGNIGEDRAIDSLLHGATDYVLKNKLARLVPAVTRAIGESAARAERARLEAEQKAFEAQMLRVQRLESIGTLAGGIAHDLNNVLAPILLSIDLLRRRFTDAESQRILGGLQAGALRGAGMVKQVLMFTRGVEGERTVLQPKQIINEMEKIVRDTFPKFIQLRLKIGPGIWPVSGDATQLHQVLLNLCVNARDAMPEGGVLTIGAENVALDEHYARMHREAKPGEYVVVSVVDTGEGIPHEIIAKIFDPFFTTKEPGKGTGLGLSTVQNIVRSHGGFINVYSEPARGTQFRIYLPAVRAEALPRRLKEEGPLPAGRGELIFVVDDEAAVCDICRATLESYGYAVVTAHDGTEAVAKFLPRAGEAAVVITDTMMPFMDGPTTIRAIRRLNPNVKIIASSGMADRGAIIDDASLGVQAFLQKPYTAQALLVTLDRVLHDASNGNAGPS